MFSFNRNQNGQNAEHYVDMPAKKGEDYSIGEALVVKDGVVTKCGATEKPTHICGTTELGKKEGETVACYPIFESYEFETTLTADGKNLKVGDKVTLDVAALNVTATTASGVAQIVRFVSKANGGTVVVKF